MRRKISIFFLLMLIGFSMGFSSYRGKGKMKGFVYDDKKNPLEGVEVKLFSVKANSGFTTKTDKRGEWKALFIRGGVWYVDFYKAGYLPKKISVKIKEYGKTITIETVLEKISGLVITDDLSSDLNKANKLYGEKKYEEAKKIYEKILSENPDAYVLNINIGNCYFQKEEYEKAISYYKKVLERDPNFSRALISIGNAYINMKNTEKAIIFYAKVPIEEINEPVVLYNIGSIYYNMGKPEKAIEYFQRIIKIHSEYADAYYQMGMCYTSLNKQKEAIEMLKKFIELNPNSDKANLAKQIIDALEKGNNN